MDATVATPRPRPHPSLHSSPLLCSALLLSSTVLYTSPSLVAFLLLLSLCLSLCLFTCSLCLLLLLHEHRAPARVGCSFSTAAHVLRDSHLDSHSHSEANSCSALLFCSQFFNY